MSAPTGSGCSHGPRTSSRASRDHIPSRLPGRSSRCNSSGLAAGVKHQLVCLPTGTGKTMLFSHLARQRMGRVLILAHRDELIQQAASKLREVDPLLSVGIALQRRRRRGTPRILVGSVQALSQPKRLAKGTPSFGTIIVDEAHHSPAPAISGSLLLWGPSSKTGLWSSE